ncbi:MAG: hypothetical protein BM562_08395 [Alphaproteobacteria bacterium MedPE-SWcel]|nr:MAG: hypothetical protein BM562_08395 [Alphaproteobacteria bacterium MedPE-SWcel]
MAAQQSWSFLLEGPFDWIDLGGDPGGFRVEMDAAGPWTPFRILDSHDQKLRQTGRALLQSGDQLTLLEADHAPRCQPAGRGGDFPSDLPDGPVRKLTQKLFPLRCFLSQATGHMQHSLLRVVGDEHKTRFQAEVARFQRCTDDAPVHVVTFSQPPGEERALASMRRALMAHGAVDWTAERFATALALGAVSYVAKPETIFAEGDTAFDVAVQIIGNYIAVARANEAGIIADLDSEFLHDYRIALRKIRSVLSLFPGVFDSVETAELKATFAALMSPTGRLRDLDVYLMEQETYAILVPARLRAGLQVMFDAFAEERNGCHARLAQHLESPSYHRTMATLADQLSHPAGLLRGKNGGVKAEAYARKRLWKRYRKICRIAEHIHDDTPDAEIHELRIACKKLRYLLEFFAPLFPAKRTRRVIKRMKRLQDNLGAFNDYCVQLDALARFVATNAALEGPRRREATRSIGALSAALDQKRRVERARVLENLDHFNGAATRADLLALCRGKGVAA